MLTFNPTLRLVETSEDVEAFQEWVWEASRSGRRSVSVDTETTGLQWWTQDFARLVQFGTSKEGWSIEVRRWGGLVEEALRCFAEAGTMLYAHNAKFDAHALEELVRHPLPEGQRVIDLLHDTMLMHHVLDPPASHALKALAKDIVGDAADVGQQVLKKEMAQHRWTWATVPTDTPSYWTYGAADTCLTAAAAFSLRSGLKAAALTDAYEIERRAQVILYGCEERGLRVDSKQAARQLRKYGQEAEGLLAALQEQGIDNPLSNPQVAAALRSRDWVPNEFTPGGQPKLDKQVLGDLAERYAEIVPLLTRYKQITKWSGTYLKPFIEGNGRVHPSIRTLGARTGRMSIADPPLQQLPRAADIRNCVLPYSDNERLWAIDYDAQELRVLAHFSNEQGLLDAIRTGQDMHRYVASLVYNVPVDEVTPAQRQITKSVQYGLIYGAGPAKLAETSGTSEQEVSAFLNRYDAEFPGVRRFMREIEDIGRSRQASAEARPYVKSLNGRPLPCDPDKVYTLVNFLIQGTCADVLKNKLILLAEQGLDKHIVLPVHDELLLSLPKGAEGADLASQIRATLEDHTTFQVPLTCEVTGPMKNWGEKYA